MGDSSRLLKNIAAALRPTKPRSLKS